MPLAADLSLVALVLLFSVGYKIRKFNMYNQQNKVSSSWFRGESPDATGHNCEQKPSKDDDVEHRRLCQAFGPDCKAVGVSTGPLARSKQGYLNLTQPDKCWQDLDGTSTAKEVIDRDLNEVKSLLATGYFNTLRYSRDAKGSLCNATMHVGDEVKSYIAQALSKFDGMRVSEIKELGIAQWNKPLRDVEFAITILSIKYIHDQEQAFGVEFYLQLAWEAQCDNDQWEPQLEVKHM